MADSRRPAAPRRPQAPRRPGSSTQKSSVQKPASPTGKAPASKTAPSHAKKSAPRSQKAPRAKTAPQRGRPVAPRSKGTVTRASAAASSTQNLKATSSSTRPAHRPYARASATPTPWVRVSGGSSNVTMRMQERLRERRSAHTRLTAKTWAKRIAMVGAAAGALWLVLLSPVLALDAEATEASGFGSVVSPTEVAEVIGRHDGTSLMMLDTGEIAAQIEQIVGVRQVDITRVWPSSLRVEILSSEPVAAVPRGDGFVLVDDRGETVDTADAPPEHLPVITIPVAAGQTRILDGVLDVVDELPVTLRDRVEGIEAQTEDSISFVLRDGPRVEWGSGEQSALKAEVLRALLGSTQGKQANVIDVSAPSLPITNSE